MANNKVLTGPLGIIKVKGITVGKMRDISVQESFQRIPIKGIGDLHAKELPITNFAGNLTCGFYMIDLNQSQVPDTIKRDYETVEEFVNSILFESDNVDVQLFKKVKKGTAAPELQLIGTVRGVYIESDSFQLSEGQVAGRNQSFSYLYPVIIGKNNE